MSHRLVSVSPYAVPVLSTNWPKPWAEVVPAAASGLNPDSWREIASVKAMSSLLIPALRPWVMIASIAVFTGCESSGDDSSDLTPVLEEDGTPKTNDAGEALFTDSDGNEGTESALATTDPNAPKEGDRKDVVVGYDAEGNPNRWEAYFFRDGEWQPSGSGWGTGAVTINDNGTVSDGTSSGVSSGGDDSAGPGAYDPSEVYD